jgi:hypothetical protein
VTDPINESPEVEQIPEPKVIQDARQLIEKLTDLVNRGEVEAISCYVENRDGGYRNLQVGSPSRHEDAGRILELAMIRLGFSQKEDVLDMIDEAL